MIKNKALIVFALTISLLFNLTTNSLADGNAVLSTTSGNSNAIQLLSNLNIMKGYDDGAFHEENEITRIEFAALIIRILGFEDVSNSLSDKSAFNDVSEDSWGKGYINLGYYLGLFQGYENDSFGPDDSISVNQAIKIIVSALGYSEIANSKGGFPLGYVFEANSLGVLKNVTSGEHPAKRGEIAVLIANSLDIPFCIAKNSENGNVVQQDNDVTFLSKLDIEIVKGVVTSVFGSTIGSNRNVEQDEVEVSGIVYKTTLINLSTFLGMGVKAYIYDNEVDEPILCHVVRSRNNDENIIVSANDIDDSTTLNEFRYWQDDKLQKAALPNDVAILYNGKPLVTNDISEEVLKPDEGFVILCDDNNEGYTTIIVWDYENYVVNSISDNKIYDRFSKFLDLDFSSSKSNVKITKNDVTISINDIATNDVLCVAKSKDGNFINIAVVNESIDGVIEGLRNDDDSIYYEISGESYKYAKNYKQAYDANHSAVRKLSTGDSVVLYLDINGRIAAVDNQELSITLKYGYLLDAMQAIGVSGIGEFKILTENNRFECFETIDKPKIKFGRNDGNLYVVKNETIESIINCITTSVGVTKQIIQYDLDKNGKIRSLYLADSNPNSEYLSCAEPTFSGTYTFGLIDQKYIVDKKTVLFRIPNSGKYEEQFSCKEPTAFFSNGARYSMTLYDVKGLKAGAMVVSDITDSYVTSADGLEITINYVNSPIMHIEKSYRAIAQNGETHFVLEGYVGKKYTKVLVSDTLSENNIANNDFKLGNIIQYQTNDIELERAKSSEYDKVMVIYAKLFDCNDKAQEYFQYWNYTDVFNLNAEICVSYGVVERYDLPNLIVSLTRNGQQDFKAPFVLGGGTVVFKYNIANKTISIVRQEDIAAGQKVFIRQRYNNVREIFILE